MPRCRRRQSHARGVAVFLTSLLLAPLCWPETETGALRQQPVSSPAQAVESLAESGPGWKVLHWSLELRGRGEAIMFPGFQEGGSDGYIFHRVRFGLAGIPALWLRYFVQAQDSGVALLGDPDSVEAATNPLDLRQAYVELGAVEGDGFQLRVGRQEINLGDERLVGSDSEWCNLGRTFDAVRATYTSGSLTLSAFGSSVVSSRRRYFDSPMNGDFLGGVSASRELPRISSWVEPYLLLLNRQSEAGSNRAPFSGPRRTLGLRTQTLFPHSFEAGSELVWQRGMNGRLPMRGWALALSASRSWPDWESEPALGLSYSAASGDKNPHDRFSGTFDDLYASGYNGAGFLDPFAWRNLRDLGVSLSLRLDRNWRLQSEEHFYWLQSSRDGLYVDSGAAIAPPPGSTSSRAGSQANLMITGHLWPRAELSLGVAHLFAGPVLWNSGMARGGNVAFLSCRWQLN